MTAQSTDRPFTNRTLRQLEDILKCGKYLPRDKQETLRNIITSFRLIASEHPTCDNNGCNLPLFQICSGCQKAPWSCDCVNRIECASCGRRFMPKSDKDVICAACVNGRTQKQ